MPKQKLERMVLAKDAKDAYRILNELDYSNYIGDPEKIEQFEKVINSGLKYVKDLIAKITPYSWIFNILWYPRILSPNLSNAIFNIFSASSVKIQYFSTWSELINAFLLLPKRFS